MKPDIYTRTVLTIIALLLAVVALRPFFIPETTAHAQTSFAGVQFSPLIGRDGQFRIFAFDTRTGEVWYYYPDALKHADATHGDMTPVSMGKIGRQLGDANSGLKSPY